MDIWVLFSWKTAFKHRGWTVAECPHCQGLEPVRVEEKVFTFSIYLLPVFRETRGWVGRCDFCGRPIDASYNQPGTIALDDWSPAQGLAPLLRKLGFKGKVTVRRAPVEERLRSLLFVAQQATWFWNANVWIGPALGFVLGGLCGTPLGLWLEARGFIIGPQGGVVMVVTPLIAAGLGALAGGLVHWRLVRVNLAKQVLKRACRDYGADPRRLEELSIDFNETVQRAAMVAREESELGIR